jgi:hypothetical protein
MRPAHLRRVWPSSRHIVFNNLPLIPHLRLLKLQKMVSLKQHRIMPSLLLICFHKHFHFFPKISIFLFLNLISGKVGLVQDWDQP